ncbi:Spt20 transcription factor [Melia azedarach]|uniref:Spt20 transcription factor n=1 Tax=Melia azedarach TaxID=155640 RepID=A0ACC1XET7_MELAZ|nr:Spt20 transcription factor [Melia azedarach]
MGVSFKVGKVGTRYRPRPVQDEVQEKENAVVSPVADTQPPHRLNKGKYYGKGDKVVNHANKEDIEVSFSLSMFSYGFSIGKATERFNGVPKQLYPYTRASDALFTAIEYGCLPGDIFGDISCNYNNGAVLCEIRDYRHCSYEKAGITCVVNSPVVHKVLLQMCMENVVKDILSVSDDSWTYKDLLEVESCLLKALQPELHLNPEPLLDKFCGAPMAKKLDLGVNWGWKKRKLNDAPGTNPRFGGQNQRGISSLQTAKRCISDSPATNPSFSSQNQRGAPCSQLAVVSTVPDAPATKPRFSNQNQRGVPCSQQAHANSISNLQKNNGLLESIVQPNALTVMPNYQSVNSCSQSALEDLTSSSLSSVPMQCFSKHNRESREPSLLDFSQQQGFETQSIQRPLTKVPKQEPVDFSSQVPPWNQPSALGMVPNYQLVDSCSQSVLGDLTSSSLYSVPTHSKRNLQSREPSSLVNSPEGVCEPQGIQRLVTKVPKQEPVDFTQQLPPWSQPSSFAMVPNYQVTGSSNQSVIGDLTSSSLSSVPVKCSSNSDSREPSSFGLSQLGRYPGSQPSPLETVPNYQLVDRCSQSVLGDLTSPNLSSTHLQCYSSGETRDPNLLVCSQTGRCEMQAIQRPVFKIPKQEMEEFSQQPPPPVNQPNPLAMVPNYQLVDRCSQSVLEDLTSSSLSSVPIQYFSKHNTESRDTSLLVHSQLGRSEMQAAIGRPMMKIPKQETVDFSHQQPYALAMVRDYQLAGSYSQSVVGDLTSSSFSSVPIQGFSKHNSGSRECSTVANSLMGRCESPAIQRPTTKIPKQEPMDFSPQQLPGSQPEFIFATGIQQNAMLHQQPGAKKVPGETFHDKKGQSLLINGGQPAILEGIPKMHAGMSTAAVRQEPVETRNFSSLDVTKIKDRYIDMDMQSHRSSLPQVQMQGSLLGTYAPSTNSPWNQLPHDRNVRKEVVAQKRKASPNPQVTAAVNVPPLSSYQSESSRREASVPVKRKKNCRLRGLNSEVSDSLALTGNTNRPGSLQMGNGFNTTSIIANSLQPGNVFNTNATVENHLQLGNGYNMDANATNLQAGNGYNANATTAASSLQLGNGYNDGANNAVATSPKAGNGYNANATAVASSLQLANGYNASATSGTCRLQLGNCRSTGMNTEVSSLAVTGNSNTIIADGLQAGNGYNNIATMASGLESGSFNLHKTSQVGDIQRFEKIKEVTQSYDLNNSNRKFDNRNPAPLVFKLWNFEQNGKLEDATSGIADGRFDVVKRMLTFMRRSHLHHGNEIPIVESKACVKLIMSKNFIEGFVEAIVSYGHEEGFCSTATLPSMHALTLFTAQFTSLMAREGYCLVSDRIEPAFLNDNNCTSTQNVAVNAGVPLVAVALGMISSSTPERSTSMISPMSDEVSTINNCAQLLLKNLNSGSHFLAAENIQSAQQNSRSNLLKLELDNAAALVSSVQQPHWQLALSNQAQLQFQILQRQRQQDQLMQSMKMMGAVSTAVGSSGTANTGGAIQGGHRNSGHGSFSNGMGVGQQNQLMQSMKMMGGVSTAVVVPGTANRCGGIQGAYRNSGRGSISNSVGMGGSAHTPTGAQISSISNVGQCNNRGSRNMPGSSDSKQRLFGGISDNAAAVLAELRKADGGQGRSLTDGFPFWNNSGMVQMQTPNIQDMAYLLSNQQMKPRNHQQQQAGVQPQIKNNFVNNVSSPPPNRVCSQQFYQQPQISPLQQLNSGSARMQQQQMNRNIVFGADSPELSSRTHISISSSSASSSKNLSGFLKTRER